MGTNTTKLSKNEKIFLNAILEHGNIADSVVCKKTGLTKSSCSRIRKKLEGSLISEYVPIIDFEKVGINVFLVLTFQWKNFGDQKFTKKAFDDFKKDPSVVFIANGDGSIASTVMFIAFENIEEYHNYLKNFRINYGKYTDNVNTLLLPSKDVIKNDFTEVIRNVIVRVENGKKS